MRYDTCSLWSYTHGSLDSFYTDKSSKLIQSTLEIMAYLELFLTEAQVKSAYNFGLFLEQTLNQQPACENLTSILDSCALLLIQYEFKMVSRESFRLVLLFIPSCKLDLFT